MEEQKPYQTIIGRKVARSEALEISNSIMANAEMERINDTDVITPCPECGLVICECNCPGQEPTNAVIEQRDRYREALIAIMGASSLRKAWEIAQKGLEP